MLNNKLVKTLPILALAIILILATPTVAQEDAKLIKFRLGRYSFPLETYWDGQEYTIIYHDWGCGTNTAYCLTVAKFSSDLSLKSTVSFTLPSQSAGSYNFRPYSAMRDSNGNIYALGSAYYPNGGSYFLTLLKADSELNPQWAITLWGVLLPPDDSLTYIYEASSNPIVVGDNLLFLAHFGSYIKEIFLYNVSTDGVVNGVYKLGFPENSTYGFSSGIWYDPIVLRAYGNSFYIVGRVVSSGKYYLFVAKVSEDLNVEWVKTYRLPMFARIFDAEIADNKLFIVGYESGGSAFIAKVNCLNGKLEFFKTFAGNNHYALSSLDAVVYGGKLYVHGIERNMTNTDIRDYDSFIAGFTLEGDLINYVNIGRSGIDVIISEAILPSKGLILNDETFVLASAVYDSDERLWEQYIAKLPIGFEGKFVWESNGEEEFEVKDFTDEISVTSKNLEEYSFSLSFTPITVLSDSISSINVRSYGSVNVKLALGEPFRSLRTYIEERMASIIEVLKKEKPAFSILGNLSSLNMSFEDIGEYLREHGKSYFNIGEGEGSVGKVLSAVREVYEKFKGSLIVSDIPPIPAGSPIYNRLIELYGPMLEKYPSVSGRLQLIHAILSST